MDCNQLGNGQGRDGLENLWCPHSRNALNFEI